jgi:hypothetical protein
MTKALGIVHGDAHTATDDGKAARQLYEAIYFMEKEAALNGCGNRTFHHADAC